MYIPFPALVQFDLRRTCRTATRSAASPHKQENISISAAPKSFPRYVCSNFPIYCDCSNVTTLQFKYMRQRYFVSAEQ